MSSELGRLECRICGRSIYFPLSEVVADSGERLIELTCSHGHSDSYWDIDNVALEEVGPRTERSRSASVGF